MVVWDPEFECGGKDLRFSKAAIPLGAICDSKNQIEIRLRNFAAPGGGSELLLLSFDGMYWDAKKYSYNTGGFPNKLSFTQIDSDSSYQKIEQEHFNWIFDTLKANNIFLLHDQDDLNIDGFIFDGLRCMLTFKVGEKFRTYHFNNPEH